jgi:LacI family transcriptional regulator
MSPSRRIPHILLLVETSFAYGRGVVEGIARYALENGPWSVQFEGRALDTLPPKWMKKWSGDGIISRTISLKAAKMIKETHLPLVEMLGSPKIGIAQVRADFGIAARMACEHFLNSGLRHFAYFTFFEDSYYMNKHRDAFHEVLEERGYECHSFKAPAIKEIVSQWDERLRPSVIKWLRSLPRPIGIYTPGDTHAVRLLDICRDLKIAVPEDMAILGVGNDPVICETLRPSLSSIDLDARRIGYEAAKLLDRKMAGKQANEIILVPPSHIAVRQSTDLMVIDDADVVQAMRFIRDNACLGIDVSHVAEEVGISLSVLERRFRKHLERTPKAEILRIQIEHAKKLLAQTDKSCASVAKNCGFNSLTYFTCAFHREVGKTPNTYRKTHRLSN